MIYTVTLNPSVDYTVLLPNFTSGKTNRAVKEAYSIGGKGLNVSEIMSRLSVRTVAVSFVAGFTGDLIQQKIDKEFIIPEFIRLNSGFSRINVKIGTQNDESEINGTGPVITQEDSEKLLHKLGSLNKGDTLILSGSIPRSLPDDYYSEIIRRVCNKDIRLVVDAEKKSLVGTLKYKPFLIKPNKQELEDIFEVKISDIDTVIELAFKLKQLGAENVLVSLGEQGAALVDSDGNIHRCEAPKGKVKNTAVGAGDSMIAGFIYGFDQFGEYDKALKMGIACGCATAFSEHLAEKEKIFEIFELL